MNKSTLRQKAATLALQYQKTLSQQSLFMIVAFGKYGGSVLESYGADMGDVAERRYKQIAGTLSWKGKLLRYLALFRGETLIVDIESNLFKESLYKQGISIGAIKEWSHADYQAMARRLAGNSGALFMVISIMPGGRAPATMEFESKDAAADQYSTITENPGPYVYSALFDKSDMRNRDSGGLIDEVTTTVQTHVHPTTIEIRENHTERVGLKWIVGGVAAGLGMLFVFLGKKKQQ